MPERIIISPQDLNDCAAFLRQRLETISEEIALLRNKVDEVSSAWEGAAQQSFVNQFENETYPLLRDTLPEVIEGMAAEMDAAANTIRETDCNLAGRFSGY